MTMAGNTFSTLLREVWTPELQTTVFNNHWMFDGSNFPVVQAPPGSTIPSGYEYLLTSNAGTYNYDDPMVEPFTSSQIKAYFNKDAFQEAARTFNVYKDYLKGGGETGNFDLEKHSIKTATELLVDKAVTTMITDMEAQVDEAATYSDASLSRTTYATIKSYEEDTPTTLNLAHIEDMIEALMTHTTYGQNVRSEEDLLLLVPRNQLTNIARLSTGVAYNTVNNFLSTSSQDMRPMDAGRMFRTKSFEGIDIVVVPDMTTTTLLCVHKPDCAIYETRPLTITPKVEAADTELALLTCSYNFICKRPGNSGKLSAKTA